jgi:hypothetical protein
MYIHVFICIYIYIFIQCEIPPDNAFKPHDLMEKIDNGSNKKYFKGDHIYACKYTHVYMYVYV